MKSNLPFVKFDTWPFADQLVIVLTVLYKTEKSVRCTMCWWCKMSDIQWSVCLFLCVRGFTLWGFKRRPSLHKSVLARLAAELQTCLFSKNKQIEQTSIIDSV